MAEAEKTAELEVDETVTLVALVVDVARFPNWSSMAREKGFAALVPCTTLNGLLVKASW